MKRNAVAIKHGFRSGLEDTINENLKSSKKKYSYETEKLSYIKPATNHTYTPDFVLQKKSGETIDMVSSADVVVDLICYGSLFIFVWFLGRRVSSHDASRYWRGGIVYFP